MNLKTLERDARHDLKTLRDDVRRVEIDTGHLATDLIIDAREEARHIADPSQRESILERHVGFFVAVMVVFTILYMAVIAVILSIPASR